MTNPNDIENPIDIEESENSELSIQSSESLQEESEEIKTFPFLYKLELD